MATISVDNAGMVGVVQDIAPHKLPPEGWSLAQNVRFRDGYAETFQGHTEVYATPTVAPYFTDHIVAPDLTRLWVYPGLTTVYAHNGTTHANISRAVGGAYNASADTNWQGFPFHGLYVLNNGSDVPQVWNTPALGTLLVDLPNWPAGYSARILRAYKTYMLAGDLTEGGTRYPHNILWSHNTEPGTVPTSWTISDPTVDAGETPLSDSREALIEMAALGQFMMLYKGDAVYRLRFVGGRYIFQIDNWTAGFGILSRRCVKDIGGKHVVLSKDDLLVHDGQSMESILTKRMRSWLGNTLDYNNHSRAFVTRKLRTNEVWACFPTNGGSGYADYALVWNWVDNTLSVRELQGFAHIAEGLYSPTLDLTIDADTAVIDSGTDAIDSAGYAPASDSLIATDPVNSKFYLLDSTQQFNGTSMPVVLERTGLGIHRQDRFGNIQIDTTSHKVVTEVWPRMEGSSGASIDIYVGTQDYPDGAVTWNGPYAFRPGVDKKIDCYASGTLLGIKFQSEANQSWKLYGYDMTVAVGGRPL